MEYSLAECSRLVSQHAGDLPAAVAAAGRGQPAGARRARPRLQVRVARGRRALAARPARAARPAAHAAAA